MAESNNPFHLYESLIERNGITDCYASFIQTEVQMQRGSFIDESKTAYKYGEIDDHGEMVIYTVRFEDRLRPKFEQAFAYFSIIVSEQMAALQVTAERSKMISLYLGIIQSLTRRANSIYCAGDYAVKWLNNAETYLIDKYPEYAQGYNAIQNINTSYNSGLLAGFFGFKGKRSELEMIYNKLIVLGFFQFENVSFDKFRDVVYSSMLEMTTKKLKISCKFGEATFIFKMINPYFNNLSDKAIADSCIFYYKDNSVIDNAKNIYKARSTFKLQKKDKAKAIENMFKDFKIEER